MKTAVRIALRRATRLAATMLVGAFVPLWVAAQAPAPAMPNLPPDMLKQMETLSGASGPFQGDLARINRMTDPGAGKRPGDEKLGCAQIKAEFDDTDRRYTAQEARQEAARQAMEAEARKAQTEASGPGAVASGFLGGLAAIGAHAVGAGDAYNEKLSERRSDAVREALIAAGVPAEAITTAWKGEAENAVPTADGVKEQANRRAEIIVQ